MSERIPDTLLSHDAPLLPGERVQHEWRADRAAYWRNHGIMALAGGVVAGGVLAVMGNPHPWVGPVAAALAIGVRAAYLASEILSQRWRLTDRRLLGPGGRAIRRGDIQTARPFLGDVQVITHAGDKHLMKYMADAETVITALLSGKGSR